jgi:hypothetical protein
MPGRVDAVDLLRCEIGERILWNLLGSLRYDQSNIGTPCELLLVREKSVVLQRGRFPSDWFVNTQNNRNYRFRGGWYESGLPFLGDGGVIQRAAL